MEAENDEEIRLGENPEQGPSKQPGQNKEGSSTTQVLEKMRNLIVELKIFKSDIEKLKKTQEDQQGINELLLRSIVTNKSPKDNDKEEEVRKISSKNFVHETKNENSSYKGTQAVGNKTTIGRKRK